MSELTKCWLQEAIAGIETIRDDMPFELDEDEQKTLAALKMALSVQDAKPVGITDNAELECLLRGEIANVMPPNYRGVDKGDEVYIYTTPQAASAPEWSNAQCMEFLTVAFRHCDISGDIEMDDIRLGVKMANAAATAPGGDTE